MPNLSDHVSCHVVMYSSHLNFVLIMHSEVCRPTETIQGVMAHGWFTGVFLVPDTVTGGGDA